MRRHFTGLERDPIDKSRQRLVCTSPLDDLAYDPFLGECERSYEQNENQNRNPQKSVGTLAS